MSKKNIIQTPGYHIRPQYDLTKLRQRLTQSSGKDYDVALPLTSMIDMFSMLVIFLLLNFSATGEAFFVNKNVKLPEAMNTREIESLPLISISKTTVTLDAEVVGSNPLSFEDKLEWEMPGLVASLRRLKQYQANLKAGGIEPKPQVNIQADQDTPVMYIKRVMNVLISEGFTGINFAVRDTQE